jgi:predicted RecA/RadA family phage recombinase
MAINDVKTIFAQDGDVIDYTPVANVTGGDIVVFGVGAAGVVGVAKVDIAANVMGAVAIVGAFDFPCAESLPTPLTKVYLTSAGLVTATQGTNIPLGRTIAPSVATAAGANTQVRVKINVP